MSFTSPASFSVVTDNSAMTSVLPMEKPTAAATAHNLQAPTLKVPHTTATTNGAGKFNSQQSPSGSPSVRKKGTNVSGGNNMSVKPIPVLSVSSFYELSAYLPSGKMDHFEKYHGKVILVVNMASCDKNTKQELTQVRIFNKFFLVYLINLFK